MRRAVLVLALMAMAGAARAAEPLRDLCPDRPGKGTSACTVDAGHWQLEVDAVDVTRDRGGGLTADSWFVAAPTLKYGLTDKLDLEVGVTPYEQVRVRDRTTGVVARDDGIGDSYLRLKTMLADGGGVAVALEPFVKLPTARHALGNGKVEAGLVVPAAFDLPEGWSLGLTGEGDWLENGALDGRHGAGSLTLGLSHDVGAVNLGVEVWEGWDFDPAGTTRQTSFDVSAAWIPKRDANLQLDGGVNFGLNHATPAAQVYAGVSRRF